MICKQCKRDVPTEDLALSGYTKQDGTKSRRNICKVCHNMNRFTVSAIRMGVPTVIDDCLEGYKKLLDRTYNGVLDTGTLPASITEAYREKYGLVILTEDASNPFNAFMDMVTSGEYSVDKTKTSYVDMINMYSLDKCTGYAPHILRNFFEMMTLTTDDTKLAEAINFLHSCSIDESKAVIRGQGSQSYGVARTDVNYPEEFLTCLFEAAESIYDEETFLFFGYRLSPKKGHFWKDIYTKLNDICGVQAIR